ncbi:MAG: TIGR03936 family radical SAM-associated protein, partial [Brevinematales bacterium]
GVCDFVTLRPKEADKKEAFVDVNFLSNLQIGKEPLEILRFSFTKRGNSRYLSPIDLEEVFSRAVIRSNLPVCYTRGFNPHFRFAFLWALPVGFESDQEMVEVMVWKHLLPEEWRDRFNESLPDGIRLTSATLLPLGTKALSQRAKTHLCEMTVEAPSLFSSLFAIPKEATFLKRTKSGEKLLVLREYIHSLSMEKMTRVCFTLTEGGMRVQDVLEAITGIGMPDLLRYHPLLLRRFVIQEGREVSLMEL